MPKLNSLIRPATIPWILVLFCWLNSHAGVDHGQYLKWAEACVRGDIEVLANEKDIRSITGIPFSPWSAGPGLLIAPMYLLLLPLGLENGAGLVTGCVCVAIFWISFYHAIRTLSSSRMAGLGCLVAAIGTPIGYYCCSISSETLALAPAGYLMWQTAKSIRGQSLQWPGAIAATGMLLMIRPFLGVFAWPALLGGLYRVSRRRIFVLASLAVVALAAVQIGMVNEWMTGNWLRTPYSFGDEQFRSFDWSAPYLWHVLLDPFHGLLPTHPLVFFGIMLLPAAAIRAACRRNWFACAIWSVYFLAVVLNVYFQACWFYWWMARSSFGMRGLVLCALPAMLCLTDWERWRMVQSSDRRLSGRQTLVTGRLHDGILFLLTFWGWLHLGAGPLNPASLTELGQEMTTQLRNWFFGTAALALVAAACCALLIGLERGAEPVRNRVCRWNRLAVVFWFLTCAVFVRGILESAWHTNFAIVLTCGWSLMVWGLWRVRERRQSLLSRSMVTATVLMICFFARLSIDVHQVRRSATAGSVETEHPLIFNWPDTRRAYLTLLEIPRLAGQREAIRGFFERNFDEKFVQRHLPRPGMREFDLELRAVEHRASD